MDVIFWRMASLLGGVLLAALAPFAQAGVCQGIVIPAYFYPGALWTKAIDAAPRTAILIMNPASGAGATQDPNYVATAKAARAAGIKVLGYVYTSYGARPPDAVKQEIDLYRTWYSVDGYFLDETAPDTANLPYYRGLARYIRAHKGGYLMLNPGTIPVRAYVTLADTTVVFEDDYAAYQLWQPPAWIYRYPAGKIAHLVHTAATDVEMADAISLSAQRNAGFVYVTNDQLNNPWNTLPSYWNALGTALAAGCAPS